MPHCNSQLQPRTQWSPVKGGLLLDPGPNPRFLFLKEFWGHPDEISVGLQIIPLHLWHECIIVSMFLPSFLAILAWMSNKDKICTLMYLSTSLKPLSISTILLGSILSSQLNLPVNSVWIVWLGSIYMQPRSALIRVSEKIESGQSPCLRRSIFCWSGRS